MSNPFGIVIRKIRKADYKWYFDLQKKTVIIYVEKYHEFDPERIKQTFEEGFDHTYVFMKGSRRIGSFRLHESGKTLEIAQINLADSYQRKGIGTWFLTSLEDGNFNKIKLQVWDNNPAKLLYRKLGYKQVKKKAHKIHMEKKL